MSEDIEQRIIKIVAETLKIDLSRISPDSKIGLDLGADSLDLVEFIMSVEAAFNCDIPDVEAAKMSTIADVAAYVKQHTKS